MGLIQYVQYLDFRLIQEQDNLRIKVWKAFLRLPTSNSAQYFGTLDRGRSRLYEKIKLDAPRTMASDDHFRQRVSEAEIVRILNSFVHSRGLLKKVFASDLNPCR